jgi:hypothetical protein
LTVVVGLDASGASKTRKPLAKRYSVIPSTEVYATAAGDAFVDFAAFAAGAFASCANTGKTTEAELKANAKARQIGFSFIVFPFERDSEATKRVFLDYFYCAKSSINILIVNLTKRCSQHIKNDMPLGDF